MDIDGFIDSNEPSWARLHQLVGEADRNVARLSPAELDELVTLYQRVSTHLSYARTYYRDPALTARLTELVARAGAVIYGTRVRTWRALVRFFADTFPAALWAARRFVTASTLVFALPAVVVALWLANSPAALDAAAPPAVREAYINTEFAEYYRSEPAAQFASSVTTNNIQVSFLAFAGGILACLPTLAVLVQNGANLGAVAGMFAAVGRQPFFWGLILPHGLLELTAIFIAGGAGLRLGWTLIDPGDRRRGEALVDEGRRAVVIVLGLALVFVVAGFIEGFVTGSPLPTWLRVGIGALAEVTFLAYVVVRGRAAAARGLTGRLGEEEAAWALPAGRRVPVPPITGGLRP